MYAHEISPILSRTHHLILDMLTDQIAQVHRSPGFITSNLIGKDDHGRIIKEYEASHGTVTDLWLDHLAGKETSLNPLGLVEALIGGMNHASLLQYEADESYKPTHDEITKYTTTLRLALHNTFRYGQGTRDMAGPMGFTTEEFVDKVAWRLGRYLSDDIESEKPPVLEEPDRSYRKEFSNVDRSKLHTMFEKYDKAGTGKIEFKDFAKILLKMGIAPQKSAEAKEPDVY
jgi:isocitrate dehydrogenase